MKAQNLETGVVSNVGPKFLVQQAKPFISSKGKIYPDGVWVPYNETPMSPEAEKLIKDAKVQAETPKVEEPKVEAPKVEETKVEAPAAPKVEETKAETSAAPKVEAPAASKVPAASPQVNAPKGSETKKEA